MKLDMISKKLHPNIKNLHFGHWGFYFRFINQKT